MKARRAFNLKDFLCETHKVQLRMVFISELLQMMEHFHFVEDRRCLGRISLHGNLQ
jgi:hypothetical protein